MNSRNLSVFFNPKSIAVIGASPKPMKLGYKTMESILKSRFKGKLYPVNIKGGNVLGLNIYRSLNEIPEDIDLAIIAIPAPAVPKIMKECGEKGVKGAIIYSAGFGEIMEGKTLEKEVLDIAKEYDITILGPNCYGLINFNEGLNLTFTPDINLENEGETLLARAAKFYAEYLEQAAKELEQE